MRVPFKNNVVVKANKIILRGDELPSVNFQAAVQQRTLRDENVLQHSQKQKAKVTSEKV